MRIFAECKNCTRLVSLNYLSRTQTLEPLINQEKIFFMGMGHEYFNDGGLVFIFQDSSICPTREKN